MDMLHNLDNLRLKLISLILPAKIKERNKDVPLIVKLFKSEMTN